MAITTSAAASSTTSPAAKQSGFKYYDYKPSEAAGILFASLFLLTTLYHLYQVIRHRAYFFIALTIGGLFEVIGYVARVKSSFETPNWQEGTYIVQALTILVAPSLFAASIYMTLGRIILVTDGERFSIIRRSWLTKIFVAGDVFSFLVLAGGSSLLTSKNVSLLADGPHIILGGLFIQIISFGLFVVASAVFHVRIHRNPTPPSLEPNAGWQNALFVLYFTSLLILVRSIMRVVEYAQGTDGYILSHEPFLYIFDATLMCVVMVAFNFRHPSPMLELSARGKLNSFPLGSVERL